MHFPTRPKEGARNRSTPGVSRQSKQIHFTPELLRRQCISRRGILADEIIRRRRAPRGEHLGHDMAVTHEIGAPLRAARRQFLHHPACRIGEIVQGPRARCERTPLMFRRIADRRGAGTERDRLRHVEGGEP